MRDLERVTARDQPGGGASPVPVLPFDRASKRALYSRSRAATRVRARSHIRPRTRASKRLNWLSNHGANLDCAGGATEWDRLMVFERIAQSHSADSALRFA